MCQEEGVGGTQSLGCEDLGTCDGDPVKGERGTDRSRDMLEHVLESGACKT